MKALVFAFAGAVFLFSIPAAALVFYPLGIFFLGLSFASLLRNREESVLSRNENGAVVWKDSDGTRALSVSDIESVWQDPSRGRLKLELKDGTCLFVPRSWENMLALGDFLTPILSESPKFVRLRQSRQGFLVYVLFILIQISVVAAAFLTPEAPVWVQSFSLLLALPSFTIAYHLGFSYPLWWTISADHIQVASLFRTKRWERSQLREFRTDRYLYAGAPYFLVRFGFGRKALVIDEYALREPLYQHRNWILAHWSV